MAKQITKEAIIEDLKEFVLREEVIASSPYPDFREEIKEFLMERDFQIEDNDFFIEDGKIDVDGDGYPYIKKAVVLLNVDVVLEVVAYHYKEWDFYLSKVMTKDEHLA